MLRVINTDWLAVIMLSVQAVDSAKGKAPYPQVAEQQSADAYVCSPYTAVPTHLVQGGLRVLAHQRTLRRFEKVVL